MRKRPSYVRYQTWKTGRHYLDADAERLFGRLEQRLDGYEVSLQSLTQDETRMIVAAANPYWKPYLEMIHEMVGHPERDKALMTANSPALNADRIKSPLLIAQGARDPRVNKDESDQMVAALKARGIDVPYIVKDN